MNLPKCVRATLRIDGEPVVELDYPSCHLRLLLAAAGEGEKASDPNFDPYTIAGLDRRAVKLGILIASAEGHIASIDLNPAMVGPRGAGIVVADALVERA